MIEGREHLIFHLKRSVSGEGFILDLGIQISVHRLRAACIAFFQRGEALENLGHILGIHFPEGDRKFVRFLCFQIRREFSKGIGVIFHQSADILFIQVNPIQRVAGIRQEGEGERFPLLYGAQSFRRDAAVSRRNRSANLRNRCILRIRFGRFLGFRRVLGLGRFLRFGRLLGLRGVLGFGRFLRLGRFLGFRRLLRLRGSSGSGRAFGFRGRG